MWFNPGAAGRQGWNNASWNFSPGKPQLPKLLVNNARKGGGGARRAIESRVGRAVEGGVRKVLTRGWFGLPEGPQTTIRAPSRYCAPTEVPDRSSCCPIICVSVR